jgi:hypothetical protein
MATTEGAGQQTAVQQTSETGDRWPLPRPLELSLRHKLEICEAAYRAGEPLAAAEALTLFFLYFKPPEWTEWIEAAAVDEIANRRTPAQAEKHRETMRYLMRYRCVRDLRRQGLTKNEALDRAVEMLASMGESAARDTIEDSYDRVSRDFRNLGSNVQAKYFLLKDKRYLDADED